MAYKVKSSPDGQAYVIYDTATQEVVDSRTDLQNAVTRAAQLNGNK